MIMKLGSAKADITPASPIPLAGFSSRRTVFDDVSRHIYARIWLFEQSSGPGGELRRALLIQADLIWWGPEYVEPLKHRIGKKWGIAEDCIFLHASHSHGGPQTTDRFSPLLGHIDLNYIDFMERTVEQAISDAHSSMEPVSLFRGTGFCHGISVNRRLIVEGKAAFAPNPEGPQDFEVTVIRFGTVDGDRTKGIWFHFTGHPTTTDDNRVTSEYCGAAMEILDRTWGEGVSCFLQGCCGDIRPSLTRDGRFYKGDEEDIERSGNALAGVVSDIVDKPMARLDVFPIEGTIRTVDIRFREIPSDEALQEDPGDEESIAVWKSMLRSEKYKPQESATLHLQLLKLADGLALLGMDGEMVLDYGLFIKNQSARQILPLGYSNGMVGYVSTAQQIVEGGYESVTSGIVFSFPSPFASEVEGRIKEALLELMEK